MHNREITCLDILNSESLRCFHILNGIRLHATTSQRPTEPDRPIRTGNVADIISVYILVMENDDRAVIAAALR